MIVLSGWHAYCMHSWNLESRKPRRKRRRPPALEVRLLGSMITGLPCTSMFIVGSVLFTDVFAHDY